MSNNNNNNPNNSGVDCSSLNNFFALVRTIPMVMKVSFLPSNYPLINCLSYVVVQQQINHRLLNMGYFEDNAQLVSFRRTEYGGHLGLQKSRQLGKKTVYLSFRTSVNVW